MEKGRVLSLDEQRAQALENWKEYRPKEALEKSQSGPSPSHGVAPSSAPGADNAREKTPEKSLGRDGPEID